MLANPRPLVATIYNPHTQSKEALIAGFIARKAKFDRLFRDIRDAPMTAPEQHYLIQGVRGMGKTTLLLRLAYEIENTPDLYARLIPIVFNEEEYGISSLADLWERTAQYLEEADPLFSGLEKTVVAQYGPDDYERRAIDTIIGELQQHGKKLLLLIDNIGDLLKKLDDQEGKRLREVLLTTADIRIVGGTPTTIDQTHDYAKPFFEFFKVVHLEGLNKTEAIDLFLKLGEAFHADAVKQIVEHQPGRIEAIRRLTGGVIRTMVLLFEIMVEENSGSVFKDLNVLLDRVTPLYKHRMDDLPTQQQKIVAALAQAWDAANTKELAQVVRLESKVVSAQLKQLINNGVVEKVETNTKNHLYRLEERFFNIWYLMRFSRRTDQRMLWLVKFFEEMFGGDEAWLEERIWKHIHAMERGQMEEQAALYLTTAYAEVSKNEEMEDFLRKKTRTYLSKNGRSELIKDVGESKHENLTKLLNDGEYERAIELLKSFKKLKLKDRLDLASCYILIDDIDEATLIVKKIIIRDEMQSAITENYVGYQQQYPHLEAIIYRISGIISQVSFRVRLNNGVTEDIGTELSLSAMASEIAMQYFYLKASDRKQVVGKLNDKISAWNLSGTIYFSQKELVKDIIYVWKGLFQKLSGKLAEYLRSNEIERNTGLSTSPYDDDFLAIDFLKLLLAKKQYHTAYNYFQQEEWQLKDRFKPLYYATLYFLQDEYPTDYLRMGPELRETVDDVLAEVAQMAIDYA